jgi:membrane protein DedA with SNARE-associated domain
MDTTIQLLMEYKYFLLFPLAVIEGPLVALAAGFLVSIGYMTAIPAFIVMLFGDLIPDSIYYYIGRYGNRFNLMEKYGHKFKLISSNFPQVERLWKTHPRKMMFFGKLAYGLSIPFLISAGLVKMTFSRFLKYAIPVTIFQYGVIMAIGYYMGYSYTSAGGYVKDAYITIAVLLIIVIGANIFISKFAKHEIEELENNPESTF